MSIGLLGNKIGMTQIFDAKGNVIPVTVIKCGPCYITQIKSESICGYNAIQLGYIELEKNTKKLSKPELGHFSKVNISPFRYLKEYRFSKTNVADINFDEKYAVGQKLTINMFKIGEYVNITGLTIGKGNLGNIKRNNFSRGPMGHGSKHHRLQGSMGAGTSPGRVFPGKRMPGRVGMTKCTIKSLEIIDIDLKENLVVIKGSIPGKSGNLISLMNVKNDKLL